MASDAQAKELHAKIGQRTVEKDYLERAFAKRWAWRTSWETKPGPDDGASSGPVFSTNLRQG